MQAISLNDFDQLIGSNRFVVGNEIGWFKSFCETESKIATILQSGRQFQAVIYKLKQSNSNYVDNFKLFITKSEALHFIEKELR